MAMVTITLTSYDPILKKIVIETMEKIKGFRVNNYGDIIVTDHKGSNFTFYEVTDIKTIIK